MNAVGMTSGRSIQASSFRRKPESRFAQRELGPGLRRDDKLGGEMKLAELRLIELGMQAIALRKQGGVSSS